MATKVAKINRKKGMLYYVDAAGNVMETKLKQGRKRSSKKRK